MCVHIANVETTHEHPTLGTVRVTGRHMPADPETETNEGGPEHIEDLTVTVPALGDQDVTEMLMALPDRHRDSLWTLERELLKELNK